MIDALTAPGKRSHVPYRSHVLTRILRSALGGSSQTLMIACASPADVDFETTLNTLRYASRARAITNRPTVGRVRRVDPAELAADNERLRAQLAALQVQARGAAAAAAAAHGGAQRVAAAAAATLPLRPAP